MPKEVKIISINFPFKTPWVVQEQSFATDRALFDFDVVIIRPYLLVPSNPAGTSSVESREYSVAEHEVSAKIPDIHRLLQNGGLLIVILDELQVSQYSSRGYVDRTIYTITNYDFLDQHFYTCIRNGTENRVEILDNAEPFSAVIKSARVEWTAYVAERPEHPFTDTRFFARNGAESFVAGQI